LIGAYQFPFSINENDTFATQAGQHESAGLEDADDLVWSVRLKNARMGDMVFAQLWAFRHTAEPTPISRFVSQNGPESGPASNHFDIMLRRGGIFFHRLCGIELKDGATNLLGTSGFLNKMCIIDKFRLW
jgi:hypothetical protein